MERIMEPNRPAANRRLVTLPEGSKIPLAYGCTDCHWRYDPKGVSELYEAATLLSAQVQFGMHECHKFTSPERPAGKAKIQAA
jgi:hypothetical protein